MSAKTRRKPSVKKIASPESRASPSAKALWKKIQQSEPALEIGSTRERPERVAKSTRLHELMVIDSRKLKEDPSELSALPADCWSAAILSRWNDWRDAESTPAAPAARKPPRTLALHWSEGHSLKVLCLDLSAPISTFAFHTALQGALSEPLSTALEDSRSNPSSEILISLQSLPTELQKRALEALAFLAQTVRWKPLSFANPKGGTEKPQPATSRIHMLNDLPDAVHVIARAQSLGQANNLVRTLTDLPANILNPGTYRDLALEIARNSGLKAEFTGTRELARLGAGAFLAVTRAESSPESGILKIDYQPARKVRGAAGPGPLALVGKGLCFDTGGYNIKTGAGMNGMHRDMSGSAVALALITHFARLKAPFPVSAHLALAENLISPTAYKANEIVTACDGTTIEVVDTDAEGRMVLSDTLALVRREKPALCLDFATLTGAAIRALDTRMGAVFTPRAELAELALRCGRASGERVWTFPLEDDYAEQLKSEVADILQCSHGTNSDHIYAATFLGRFIGEETPWLHLDLSAAKNKGGLGLITSTTTGFGVRWAAAVAEEFFEKR
jgi:leucyl aminopeptidase